MKHHIGQHGLDSLGVLSVLLGVVESLLWVVLELEGFLAFLDLLVISKCCFDPSLPLNLPAGGVAVERLSILVRVADGHDPSVATLAVVPHLGLTRSGRAVLSRMALGLAPMRTVLAQLVASLATAMFHQFLEAFEALALLMTDFLADVAAFQREAALSTTRGSGLVAKDVVKALLSTSTGLCNEFHTLWAVAKMAADWTLVTTFLMNLLTRTIASRLNLPASHWRIDFSCTTRTEERLSRVDLAGLARSDVAEVITLVDSAAQSLVAGQKTQMNTIHVSNALLDRAADSLAFVLLTDLVLVADLLTSEVPQTVEVLLSLVQLPSQSLWIVDYEAGNSSLTLTASARLNHLLFASHTGIGVASLSALMLSTG